MIDKRGYRAGLGWIAFLRGAPTSVLVTVLALALLAQGGAATSTAPSFSDNLRARQGGDDGRLTDEAITSASLTLVRPNGGETWEAGAAEIIIWGYSGLTGDVRLEYSIDGKKSWKTITDGTPGTAGAYQWTVPNDPSTNAYVRVSSNQDPTVSDTNDGAFTIAKVYDFQDSYAAVSPANVEGGGTATYRIVLYESDSATLTVTDTLPSTLTYVEGSLQVEPSWKRPAEFVDGEVRWSDLVTDSEPVTITFGAQVTATTATMMIFNPILVSRNGAAPRQLDVTLIVNGVDVYLPMVVKGR